MHSVITEYYTVVVKSQHCKNRKSPIGFIFIFFPLIKDLELITLQAKFAYLRSHRKSKLSQ